MAAQEDALQAALSRYARELEEWQKYVKQIEQHISHVLSNEKTTYHSITSREKSYTSFEDKAKRKSYEDIYGSIQDKAGVRIITYLQSECDEVQRVIEPEFELIREECIFRPAELGVDQMGYRSTHLVCLPSRQLLEIPCWKAYEGWPFEIQIRSLLEHAWAELSHPRAYKFHGGSLPRDLHRRFYIVAGVLELCDREFDGIAGGVKEYENSVAVSSDNEKAAIDLNAASLSAFLSAASPEVVFESMPDSLWQELILELRDYGINTLADLTRMLPEGYPEALAKSPEGLNAIGVLRVAMVIADHERYFSRAWTASWGAFDDRSRAILAQYGLDADEIRNAYRMSERYREKREMKRSTDTVAESSREGIGDSG